MRPCRRVRMPTETGRKPARVRDRMTMNSRKRPLVEMLACVVLVAALAVQPALGRDGKTKSRESGGPAAQAQTAMAFAPAAVSARPATRPTARRRGRSGRTRQVQAAVPAPAPVVDP